MNRYELVTIIDAQLGSTEIVKVSETIEALFAVDAVRTKDDIGILPVHQFLPAKAHHIAYFVSYDMMIDWSTIWAFKKSLKLVKWLQRFTIFSISEYQTFKEINEKYIEFVEKNKKSDKKVKTLI